MNYALTRLEAFFFFFGLSLISQRFCWWIITCQPVVMGHRSVQTTTTFLRTYNVRRTMYTLTIRANRAIRKRLQSKIRETCLNSPRMTQHYQTVNGMELNGSLSNVTVTIRRVFLRVYLSPFSKLEKKRTRMKRRYLFLVISTKSSIEFISPLRSLVNARSVLSPSKKWAPAKWKSEIRIGVRFCVISPHVHRFTSFDTRNQSKFRIKFEKTDSSDGSRVWKTSATTCSIKAINRISPCVFLLWPHCLL